MTYSHPTKPLSAYTWDWKEQPNWNIVAEMIEDILLLDNGFRIIEIENGSDEHCIVVGNSEMTNEEAIKFEKYAAEMEDSEDIDIDWDHIIMELDRKRMDLVILGEDGLDKLNECNRILSDYYRDDVRSIELYNEIINLI